MLPLLPALLGLSPALAAPAERPAVVVGVEVDAAVTVDTPPGATVLPRLDLGVALPVVGQRLEPFLTGGYAPLWGSGEGEDARLPGGAYTWSAREHEGIVGGGLRARFLPLASRFNGHVSLAGAAFVHRTLVSGEADGAAFGEHRERWTSGGLLAGAGADIRLGPGLLGVEVGVVWTPWDGTLTGERSWIAVTPGVSYRALLGPGAPGAPGARRAPAEDPARSETELTPGD